MKNTLLTLCCLATIYSFGQEHFSGINISKRNGLLNATVNPAELTNMTSKYEINAFAFSANVSNNKISIGDVLNGDNVEDKIFTGSEPVNLRLDAIVQGPGFGMRYKKWGFAVTSAGNIKSNAIDVDVNFGNALTNSLISSSQINSNYNQRMNAMTWGEIGLSAARDIFENEMHKFSAGATFKMLFPGSYMNLGVDRLNGTVTNVLGDVYLSNAYASVNIAYSGNLANDYSDSSNYSKLFAGGLNGYAVDFGVNYQWKGDSNDDTDYAANYKLNAGASVRNLGSMKFKDDNNNDTDYTLEIQGLESLNLNQFEDTNSITDIEQTLLDSGYLTKNTSNNDFKVTLPTVLNAYVDYNLYNKWYISGYLQQKISDDTQNDFSTIQNIVTLTPRFAGKNYEIYVPFSQNEVSDFTTGFGFRLAGFFMGSGSAITALLNDSKQADFYMGYRVGF
ncbi:DUF5723 family protein [Flavobacterium chuncheonense]|uniref:DUF5723 family protein n=1 Tax=Flavobacterium chuncheonense TaxID=2026653 RepID=A0ABW5YHI3_9FLAO